MSGLKTLFTNDINFVKSPFYVKYGVPVFLLLWVTLLKVLVDSIGQQTPYLLYFGVVIITARYFGEKAAVLITVLAAIIANYFFVEPYNSFSFTGNQIVQGLVFIAECGLIIGLTRSLAKAVTNMNKSDMLFKTMVEKSAEAIVMNNAEGKRLYCSPSIQHILGYTTEEFMLTESWTLSHQDELLSTKEQYYRLASHPGKTIIVLHRIRHKNGNWIWIESRITNMLHEPLINAMILSMTNVTERVILEKQRENFIGIASHELKTPLTSLKAYTQVLQNRFKNDPDHTSYGIVNKIDKQVNRIIHMITDLLDLTTFQAGKLTINKLEFDFNALVLEIVDNLQQTTKKHRLVTELAPVKGLVGDKSRISQIITNLISNAVNTLLMLIRY